MLNASTKIKVVYIENITSHINERDIEGVDFISIDNKSDEEITNILQGTDMVFTIAFDETEKIAKIAKECGALVLSFVDKEITSNIVDTYFVIEQNKIIEGLNIIQAIVDLIEVPGLVNLDFHDVKSVLGNANRGYVGTGEAVGKNATTEAVKLAIDSIENISNAKSLLLNILGSPDSLSMIEINEASVKLQEAVHQDAEIIWGVSVDESFGERIKVTIVAANIAV